MTGDTTPQGRAVAALVERFECGRDGIIALDSVNPRDFVACKKIGGGFLDFGAVSLGEIVDCLADAGLLCSSPVQPEEEDAGSSLRSSKPSAAGRVWTHDDLEPAVNPDLNFPAVVDKHDVRWIADERHDGFAGWRTDSHGLVVWRTWFDLAFNRGPLTEVVCRDDL